jgi:hypothetical protein
MQGLLLPGLEGYTYVRPGRSTQAHKKESQYTVTVGDS